MPTKQHTALLGQTELTILNQTAAKLKALGYHQWADTIRTLSAAAQSGDVAQAKAQLTTLAQIIGAFADGAKAGDSEARFYRDELCPIHRSIWDRRIVEQLSLF
jgi:hypothetical protein